MENKIHVESWAYLVNQPKKTALEIPIPMSLEIY